MAVLRAKTMHRITLARSHGVQVAPGSVTAAWTKAMRANGMAKIVWAKRTREAYLATMFMVGGFRGCKNTHKFPPRQPHGGKKLSDAFRLRAVSRTGLRGRWCLCRIPSRSRQEPGEDPANATGEVIAVRAERSVRGGDAVRSGPAMK